MYMGIFSNVYVFVVTFYTRLKINRVAQPKFPRLQRATEIDFFEGSWDEKFLDSLSPRLLAHLFSGLATVSTMDTVFLRAKILQG